MSIVYGVIFKATDGTTRFIKPSGRMYIWAYGAWRFKCHFHEATYRIFSRAARLGKTKMFVASSRKLFMEKRVALDPIDYIAIESIGRRLSKARLLRPSQVAKLHQNAAVACGKKAHQRLTGYQPCITPTPFYAHKMRPPKNR